jgi:hypothetical protein
MAKPTRLTRTCRSQSGKACPLWPGNSDIDLFDFGECIVYLNSKVSDGAFDIGVTEQQQ